MARWSWVVFVLVLSSLAVAPAATASTTKVPFTDPQSVGYIGLCDLAGHNVTSGSTASTPFAWKAVSSAQPPATYQGAGQNANLTIYQAVKGVDPGDWTGLDVTAATNYKIPSQPTAEATYKDESLASLAAQLPPKWDGLYVLRMEFGKTGYGVYTGTYPSTVIQITGATWHVVSGGLVNCAHAKAVPQEVMVGVSSQLPKTPIKNLNPPTAPPAARASNTSVPTPLASATATSSAAAAKASAARRGLSKTIAAPITAPVLIKDAHDSGSSNVLLIVIVVAGVVVAALGGMAFGRRRPKNASS